jgi:formamidopyrimidine-DNA glycosylase
MGETIRRCEVRLPRLITCPNCDEYCRMLTGSTVEGVSRRGKYLIFSLDKPYEWIVHLGMSGSLRLSEEGSEEPKHTHILLHLSPPLLLRYVDPRTFGESAVVPTGDYRAIKGLASMGPEPLERSFTPAVLKEILKRTTKIKPLLMDQSRIAGIGNIYSDEILFQAGIEPLRPANSLDDREVERLFKAIREVLKVAIRKRGSSVDDFVDLEGRPGRYQLSHLVYGREGEPCIRCGKLIRRRKIGGRSSYYCPGCQS